MLLAFQILGLSLGVIGWCLENSCTSSHSWRVRSHSGAVTTNNWQFEGLWMTCAATSLGSVQCQRYKTVLGLPEYVHINIWMSDGHRQGAVDDIKNSIYM
ncbi:unnamed protein product [Oncorhynchus mykiss]|uniref:Claudin n=1 Tax=Oncorhynchus mykiss TaxID=8022 RepID=A0A060W605_ONCMY|nr:unnamed protein product [Oncorhynchus mykiss]